MICNCGDQVIMSSWHNHHHYHLKILHIDALSFGLQSTTLAGLLTNIKISAEVGPKVVQEQIRTRVVEKFLCSNFILSVDSIDLKIEDYQKCTFKTLYIVRILKYIKVKVNLKITFMSWLNP